MTAVQKEGRLYKSCGGMRCETIDSLIFRDGFLQRPTSTRTHLNMYLEHTIKRLHLAISLWLVGMDDAVFLEKTVKLTGCKLKTTVTHNLIWVFFLPKNVS